MCFSIHVDKNINKLSSQFGATLQSQESAYLKSLVASQALLKDYKLTLKFPEDDGRIFSNYFTYVVHDLHENRTLTPMRYRVRPKNSIEEIPAKYNVFNARLDALESRQTWKNLFMKNHGLVPLNGFYEWVTPQDPSSPKQKVKMIYFYPRHTDIMWAPCLWDEWVSPDGKVKFKSFAIITDGPPKEIETMGHDRCPIFLKADEINNWLNPQKQNKKSIYDILQKREEVYFDYQWA